MLKLFKVDFVIKVERTVRLQPYVRSTIIILLLISWLATVILLLNGFSSFCTMFGNRLSHMFL